MNEPSDAKRKSGVAEWAEHKVNCCRGCSHGCLYCYAREMALRYKRLESGSEWKNERPISILDGKTDKAYGKKYNGVVMFPTTHDWTEGTMNACYEVLNRLLASGNEVLLVSKLSWRHVESIIACIDAAGPGAAERLEIRVTCGGLDERTREFWEPGAPPFEDRLEAIQRLRMEGCFRKLSASAEPLLEPRAASELVSALVSAGVTEVWIGMLRDMARRVAWKYIGRSHWPVAVRTLDGYQREPHRIRGLVEALRPWGKIVKWKDSYAAAIGKLGLEL